MKGKDEGGKSESVGKEGVLRDGCEKQLKEKDTERLRGKGWWGFEKGGEGGDEKRIWGKE